jgi:hypothetical protein
VRATVKSVSGFSAHADKNGLLRWLQGLQEEPQMIFVNHGEESQSLAFGEAVHQQLGLSTTVPEAKASYQLELHPSRSPSPSGVARRPPMPEVLRREATRFERESQNLEARLRKLFTELSESIAQAESSTAVGARGTAAMLEELHQGLERLVESVGDGTESLLRKELDALGLRETKPWSELLRLVGVRRRTIMQSHEELRATILKLAERLPQS